MSIKIALAGNPNCGKTTLFNALTGSNQFVGNWPGVTVEKLFLISLTAQILRETFISQLKLWNLVFRLLLP